MNGKSTELSIILPVYRNAETLTELHDRLSKTLQKYAISYEIIFVNDASPDHSLLKLKNIVIQDSNVSVISLAENVGQHCALLIGLMHAKSEYYIFLDADLQDSPEDIAKLINAIKEVPGKFSAVYAQRFGDHETWPRLVTSYIFKKIIRLICKIPNGVGSFVIFNDPLKAKLLTLNVKKPYIIGMIMCANMPVSSTTINRSRRSVGKSSYSSWKRLKLGFQAVITIVSLRYLNAVKNNTKPRWLQKIPSFELIRSDFESSVE